MGKVFMTEVSSIVFAILAVVFVSILVSKNAKTVELINSASQFFGNVFGQILKPVS